MKKLWGIIALLVLVISASGLAISASAEPPEDNGQTCEKDGYPDNVTSYSSEAGTVTFDGQVVTYTVNDGYVLDICVKGGSEDPIHSFTADESGTYTHPQNVSHIGVKFTVVEEPPEECPEGQTGTPPNCEEPPEECPEGETGTPPNCEEPPEECPGGDQNGDEPGCDTETEGEQGEACPDDAEVNAGEVVPDHMTAGEFCNKDNPSNPEGEQETPEVAGKQQVAPAQQPAAPAAEVPTAVDAGL
jgi:hypothetical protein